jgi:hypothetical protein
MKRTWTIVGVTDVARSLRWYQPLLGLPDSPYDYFWQIVDSDGTVVELIEVCVPVTAPITEVDLAAD